MSERSERLQYAQMWTAAVYLQTQVVMGETVTIPRRREFAYVPPDRIATVEFAQNQYDLLSSFGDRSPATTGTSIHKAISDLMAVPRVGWKLVSQGPICVVKIRLKNVTTATDQSIDLGSGAFEGSVRIPPFTAILFDLARADIGKATP